MAAGTTLQYQKIQYGNPEYYTSGPRTGWPTGNMVPLDPPVFAWLGVDVTVDDDGNITNQMPTDIYDVNGAVITAPLTQTYGLVNGGAYETPPSPPFVFPTQGS
jgi:hypothetical protein